jgi:hypothetical protein
MECNKCGYNTENKKSFANHIRYGCGLNHENNEKCLYCNNIKPIKKPSERGYYCNRACYFKHVNESSLKSGKKSGRYITGESRTRLYSIWLGIKRRCTKSNCKDYKNYGGRGITFNSDWSDFLIFKDWAEKNGYQDNLTIERIDVNGNYTPTNCTWIPNNKQWENTRKNKTKNNKTL